MTIKELVLNQSTMKINDWINFGKLKKLSPLEIEILIKCADYYNKIEINHEASFKKAINI